MRGGRIRELFDERRPAYGAIPHHVDTTGRTPEEIVDDVIRILDADAEVAGMTILPVRSPSGAYKHSILLSEYKKSVLNKITGTK